MKDHPWFAGVDWDAVYACRVRAPYRPPVRGPRDTSNFDDYPESDTETAGGSAATASSGEDTARRLTGKEAEAFHEFDTF